MVWSGSQADPIAFEEFCAGFREAQNPARMEQPERIAATKREFDRVTRDIQKIIEAILAGIPGDELKAKMEELQSRKATLLLEMARLEEPEPLLHPSLGHLCRQKVEQLAAALEAAHEIERERAKGAIRGFIERIVIPIDEHQPLQVSGISGRCWQQQPTVAMPRRWLLLLIMVAGARLRLYRKLCWVAA